MNCQRYKGIILNRTTKQAHLLKASVSKGFKQASTQDGRQNMLQTCGSSDTGPPPLRRTIFVTLRSRSLAITVQKDDLGKTESLQHDPKNSQSTSPPPPQ